MIRRVLSSLILLALLAAIVITGWLAGSESGTRVAIAYISGITSGFSMRHEGGTLVGPLQLRKVVFKSAKMRVEIDRVHIDWSPACLLVGELCLREVRVGEAKVILPPAAAVAPGTRRRLPDITLPLSVDLSRLTVASLDIVRNDKSTRFNDLEASLAWQGNELRVDRLVVGMPGWEAKGAGNLTSQGDWPVTAMIEFVTPRRGDAVFSMRGTGSGSLVDAQLALESDGLLQARLAGQVQPLERGIPFNATLTARGFRIPPRGDANKSAQLQDIALAGHGELLGEFVITGTAGLDTPWTPLLPARLASAHGTWRGLDRAELLLEDPRLRASIISDYRWLGGQHFDATVDIAHLDLTLVNAATPSRLAGTLQVVGAIDKDGTVIDINVDALDGTFRQWPLAVRGPLHWRDAQWVFDALQLRIGENRAVVTGTLDDAWDAKADLTLPDLHTLLPAFAGSAGGNAIISGAPVDPRFALTLAAENMLLPAVAMPAPLARSIRLPAADWQIRGIASLGDLTLQDMRTDPGQPFALRAGGRVSWKGPLQWDLDSEIGNLLLQDLLPELAGDVHGRFASSGTLSAQLDRLHVDTQLQGYALELPLAIDTRLDYAPDNLQVHRLDIAHGDNKATLSAALDNRANVGSVALALDVNAPALANSLRDLGGAARVQARISGTQARPDMQVNAALTDITWQDLRLGRFTLVGDINDGFFADSSLTATAENLAQGKQLLQVLNASVTGVRSAHTITLAAQATPLEFHATLSGGMRGSRRDDIDWQGQLDSGVASVDTWRWENAGTPMIHYRAGQVAIAPHCWHDTRARACLTSTAEIGHSGHLDAEIFHLPFDALLGDLLPIDTLVDGKVGGTLSLAWENGGLASLRTDIRNEDLIRLALVDDEDMRTLGEIDTLQLAAELDSNAGKLQGTLHGDRVGELQARATLGAGGIGSIGQRALSAQVQAGNIQFALLEAFTYQLRDTGGNIDGAVDIGGTLQNPQFSGRLDLVNGRTGFTRLPVNLVDINMGSRFSGEQATFSGSLRTAESTGIAAIKGDVHFSGNDWQARGTLNGSGLVFSALPQFQFTTAPELALSANAEHFGIDGTVYVPAGRIEMQSLPAQSVGRSRDVVMISEEKVIAGHGIGLRQNVDVDFVLGKDVYFHAFGGEGRLGGNLRVRSTPELPLLVNGELHVYDGKYVAFGQSLNLKQADIIFNGPADQPLIDALASRSFDESAVREVGLRLTGSLRAPQTTLWSTPPLPDEEALSWLATGRPLSEGPISLRGEAAQAALSLGVAQGSALLTAAGQEIGLQDVQLATIGDGDNAEVQVGTNVNEKVFVGFNRRVFTGDESVLVRLHLTRRLMLEALSGIDSAIDIFYTFEF